MVRHNRPGIDENIATSSGVTHDGQLISYNRAPSPDLAPWIARLYVTAVKAPSDHRIECGLLNDTSFIRIQLSGCWEAMTAGGHRAYRRSALYFGPQSKLMPISVTGSFISVGMSLRPGACKVLKKLDIKKYVDQLATLDDVGMPGDLILGMLRPDAQPEEWLNALEDITRLRVDEICGRQPDPISSRFEEVAFTNPTVSISALAREWGIEHRTLSRLIERDFGLSPKQVLRRARALDLASYLRGVADSDEAEDLILRYYDQSHLIREFQELFGMSPNQFVERSLPILTFALESRQARRLEAIKRLAPGQLRPWEMQKLTQQPHEVKLVVPA